MMRRALLATLLMVTPVLYAKERILLHRIGPSQSTLFIANADGSNQHVDTRGRENDLAPVIKMHPELLGIGLDESTSITVHGNTLTCNGSRRAAIWDGKDHGGKGFYYLHAGDSLDLVTHVATFSGTPQTQ